MDDSLRDELRSLPGVADAEVDGDGTSPANVRVRLHPEADPTAVGRDIQRVLASHGMRSRIATPEPTNGDVVSLPAPEAPVPPRPEAPPPLPPEPLEPPPGPAPQPVVREIVTAPAAPIEVPDAVAAPEPVAPEAEAPAVIEAPTTAVALEPAPAGGAAASLASLAVEESADGVVVVATATDGRRFTRRAGGSQEEVAAAVVAVVGALSEGRPPTLLSVTTEVVEGTEAVTVILQKVDGTRLAGASIVRAGRAYAVARATWSALHA